jgi:membrane protease YdiL (CAAX protease family)
MADDADEAPESPEEEAPPAGSSDERARQTVVLLAVLVEGGLFVLATLLGWALGQSPMQYFGWDGADALRGVAAALPPVALFAVLQRWPVGPLARIRRFSEQVIRPILAPCSVLDLLGISVLAGLGEEMLFRGVLQASLAHWLDAGLALAVASLLFGLMHAITLTYALLATLMGAYLGAVWVYTGNLLVVIITHALYDFVVLLWLMRGPGSSAAVPAAPAGPPDDAPPGP